MIMARLDEADIDVEQLRLDQLYLAVVPSIYLSVLPDGSSPEEKLGQVLNHEASIQHLMNKFRTKQFGFDVAYKTVRDGLAKNRLLVDHATQILSSDIMDLDELFETGHQIVLELQSMDTEFNQIYEMIPVELDRKISELYSKLYNEAMDNIAWQSDRSLTYLERLFKYFDQQYQDAVASLLRWWKHYDEMLMVSFERDAMVGNNDVQIMVRTYQKQLRSRNVVLEGLQRDAKILMDQIKELDERKKHAETTSRGKIINKERELEQVTETSKEVAASVEVLRNEEMALQETLSAKRVAVENLSDEVTSLKRQLEEKTLANKNALMAAAAELDQERSTLAGMVKEYEDCQTLLNAPEDINTDEIVKQESLQMHIKEAKREQISFDQQQRIAEQEVRGLDRIYDKRFLVLQKIGFVLRNETYLRRLLERKFYRSSNFMSLKELSKMDESQRKKSMAKDPELKTFGDDEPATAAGDRLSISSSMNLLQSLLTNTEPDNCTVNAIILAKRVEEPDGWW